MSTSPIRVFIVEDQPAILKAQVKILSNAKELEIIGSAMSGEQALEAILSNAQQQRQPPLQQPVQPPGLHVVPQRAARPCSLTAPNQTPEWIVGPQ